MAISMHSLAGPWKFLLVLPKTRELIHRLKNQGAVQHTSIRHLWKIIQRHPNDFSHFRIETEDMLSQIFDWDVILKIFLRSSPPPPALMGPPMGSTRQKQHTTVVDPKFIPNMPADFLQIKLQSKGHWTCGVAVNTMCAKCHTLPPYPSPPPIFCLFPTFSNGLYNTWEVWNGTWIHGGISFQ